MSKFKNIAGIITLALGLSIVPTIVGTPESGTVEAAEAVPYTCGTPRWGYQYHYRDVWYGFVNGQGMRYREDYRWYCHPQGYWYRAIYYRGLYAHYTVA